MQARLFFVIAASVAILLTCQASEGQRSRPQSRPDDRRVPIAADLRKDERLQRKISFDGERLLLNRAMDAVSEAAEVDLIVQGDLLRKLVYLSVRDKTCAQVMENLATLFGGVWVKRHDAYILVTDEVLAGLVAQWPGRARDTEQAVDALLNSLTPAQINKLRRTKKLTFEDLTPQQKGAALSLLRDAFFEEPGRFPSSILMGKGFYIEYSGPQIHGQVNGDQTAFTYRYTVGLHWPMVDPQRGNLTYAGDFIERDASTLRLPNEPPPGAPIRR